jgi:predicted phage baseplate assembly protein
MSDNQSCGCDARPCGCCAGIEKITPMPICNRPGLAALAYRAGTHAGFLETMKARLATMTVDRPSMDGQPGETTRPLAGLTTRDPSDPSIALLDAWATVAEVLTFYQERNANEGYLRTATERRSVLELAGLVGYVPRPGVAASVYLAYTVDENQVEPTLIAAGSAAQSIPGPGETSETFETSEDLQARREWNNLSVRRTRPQNITLAQVLRMGVLYITGPTTTVKKGDPLLFVFDPDGKASVLRRVLAVGTTTADNKIAVTLAAVPVGVAATAPLLADLIAVVGPLVDKNDGATARAVEEATAILHNTYMGDYTDPAGWAEAMRTAADGAIADDVEKAITAFGIRVEEILKALGNAPGDILTDPSRFVGQLLRPRIPQVANSLRLRRDLKSAFRDGTDAPPQILLNFAPVLKDSYYAAWSNADVNSAQAALVGVFALRATASLFGAGVSKQPTYFNANDEGHSAGELKPQSQWLEWTLEDDEQPNALFLDQPHDGILAQSYVILQKGRGGQPTRRAYRVATVDAMQRTAYGISGKTARLTVADDWWTPDEEADTMATLRSTLVLGDSEQLTVAEEPIGDDVSGQTIELGELYRELQSGRWVILSGERADIPGVSGVRVSELLMISALEHGYDPRLPGDRTHTTLQLATKTAYHYKREGLTIYGNVAHATHGGRRTELLGSGDGAATLQAFTLKQPPVTFVSAPTAAGAESTLHVYVNDIEWHETDSLAYLGKNDRAFVTMTDDAANTTVIFGDGEHGARLPTGVLNVASVYRGGIGAPGNVKAEQISLLQTSPLGVRAVINPLRTSGGADKESRDLARQNAPLSVMPLDRLVSIADYADFAREFAGIAKALGGKTTDGSRSVVYLTIAGVDDAPIDVTSDLYLNLLSALRDLGDPDLPLRVDLRELKMLVLSARIRVLPDYRWEPLATTIRGRLLEIFGFGNRALGQPAILGEAIGTIQAVRGVEYVDVDAFGAIPEKTVDANGTRRLLTQDEITDQVRRIADHSTADTDHAGGRRTDRLPGNVPAFPGGADRGVLRPAELIVIVPAVPDTVVLNEIK